MMTRCNSQASCTPNSHCAATRLAQELFVERRKTGRLERTGEASHFQDDGQSVLVLQARYILEMKETFAGPLVDRSVAGVHQQSGTSTPRVQDGLAKICWDIVCRIKVQALGEQWWGGEHLDDSIRQGREVSCSVGVIGNISGYAFPGTRLRMLLVSHDFSDRRPGLG